MPPKPTSDPNDNSEDDESQDASGIVRALHNHAARVEQLVAQDRELATQQFRALIQENQRIAAESQSALADALATAVGKAISQNIQGVSSAQPGSTVQPPPVAAFGGLRLHTTVDTQPTYPPSTSDAWQLGASQEYQPNPATHAAAAAAPPISEPRVFAPFPAAPDPGRFFVPPEFSYNPYGQFNPQITGRQRVFTVGDPPSKRDIAEAFIHVQQAARNSQHIGRREVAELQLLECFVQVWDCRCIGLPARDKLRIFDRVRLLYHVAQSGWGAALEGYADPFASLLLGPPVPPRRPAATHATSPERGTSPPRTGRPNTRSSKQAKSPKKPKK
ncbi:unnamed protein product [Ixodes persulcatus]